MTDGLATALIIIVAILACIAGGVAWWVHRPIHNAHDPVSRVQPLFGGDGVRFADAEDDGSYDDDEYDDADLDRDDEPARDVPVRRDLSPRAEAGALAATGRQPSVPAHPSSLTAPRPPERQAVAYAGARTFATAPSASPAVSASASGSASPAESPAPARAGDSSQNSVPSHSTPGHAAATDATRFSRPSARPDSAVAPMSAAPTSTKPAAPTVGPGTAPSGLQQPAADEAQHAVASGVQPATAPVASRAAAPVVPVANTTFTSPTAWNGGNSVQFSIPTDGTLQFLPGRLELIAGTDTGREIRFVRLPDAAIPEITFGRTAGTPYRHIQLLDGTVSRMHASMRLENGRWSLTNRSTTNPVVYNGEVLGEAETRALDDGDRIEMGELAFRFRSR